MSDNYADPSGNTEAFRAFTQDTSPEPAARSKTPLIVAAVVGVVVLLAVLVWVVVG